MKYILLLSLIVFGTSLHAQEVYGQSFKSNQPASTVAEATGETIQLTGEIESTCAMKGCWMKVQLTDGETVRVTFKDYGFFVPTSGAEGKKAIVKGQLSKKEISVETLRHYAEDAGKSEEEVAKITSPKMEYSFVADGVIIEDNKD